MTGEVLRFKVQLRDIRPPSWRRMEMPASYTFWDLHVAIQDAMGWLDSHLHAFRVRDRTGWAEAVIGIPESEEDPDFLPGWRVRVVDYLGEAGMRARYEYDFGDDWQHDLTLEAITPGQARTKYPRCVAGAGTCPPEDCGGPHGYARLLETLANPADPEHAEMVAWVGGPFDPKAFDPREVRFDNPKERWEIAFGEPA